MTALADELSASRLVDRRFWLAMVPCLLAFAICHAMDYELPGLYMDVVNPDFAGVVFFASPYLPELGMQPGNMPYGRIPILTSLYHGSLHAWIGAPAFYLFGTSIETLRVVHGLCAAALLLATGTVLRSFALPLSAIAAVMVALAIDPAFVFSFRTQNYITAFPSVFLFVAFVLFLRATAEETRGRRYLLSGFLTGLAVYGYFVYAFFLPVFAVALCVREWNESRAKAIRMFVYFCTGVALGCVGYIVGYALIFVNTGGTHGFIEYLLSATSQLGVVNLQHGFLQRLDWLEYFFDSIAQAWWNSEGMLGMRVAMPYGNFKSALLLTAPAALAVVAAIGRQMRFVALMWVGLVGSFFVGAFGFGARLGGHHFVVAYLMCVVAGVLACYLAWTRWPKARALAFSVGGMLILAWSAQSLGTQSEIRGELRRSGGFNMFSDSINRLGSDFMQTAPTAVMVTPDWGFFAPLVYFTAGRREVRQRLDTVLARRALCDGRDLLVVLAGNGTRAREIDIASKLGIGAIARRDYRQRDGRLVFTVSTWRADRGSAICEAMN